MMNLLKLSKSISKSILSGVVCLMVVAVSSTAHAALDIEISGGNTNQIPIAIIPFGKNVESGAKEDVAAIIAADLKRSGLFRVIDPQALPSRPVSPAEVKFGEWAVLQAQAISVGTVEPQAGGRLKITFHLMDVFKQSKITAAEYTITPAQLRLTAHKIADAIYQKMTGERGVFSTRIAYVKKVGKHYSLEVADADGFNPQTVVSSNEPLISPAWSPDGSQLAYVSFEKKKPIIFVQSLMSGQRDMVASFKGNNSAPAWSPDGSRLAIVLTYGANSQIYIINANGGGLKQIMKSSSIDTEPVFSPDGAWLYFSSDRGGKPQIYKVPVAGGSASRVTFEGGYNVSPRFSPDGQFLTFIHNEGGSFKVATQELSSGKVHILSDGNQDESPSFAPNGRVILYATKARGRGTLAAVSADGKTKQRLNESSGGDIREPAWGPFVN